MASKAASKRLAKEYILMQREPPPFIWAAPDEKNILNWNYLIRGPPDSPFEGGEYHGVLMFPPEYPFKPPGIKMLTPSGRFAPDKKICFSMSDFHPASWNPAWSVATILTGLLSFMLSDEITTGSVNTTDADKRAWARKSHSYNVQQRKFKEAFPEYCTAAMRDLPNMGESARGKSSDPAPSQPPQQSTPQRIAEQPRAVPAPQPAVSSSSKAETKAVAEASSSDATGGWADVIWQKWRWGLFIAIAVIVSRLSSS
ncbi:UBC-like protein [Thelephora terrestris]|jgi:ubiquitin-conjugating enzyme E2 J2|uniref:Ubiquitin-conjugating enzyme E2 6 n=1 Tax=Thelephora terrestris TaxID=56493 RepID=A0A9P6H6J3_9AGAM|nr:UBC-like protein [Thelephora terrestris]